MRKVGPDLPLFAERDGVPDASPKPAKPGGPGPSKLAYRLTRAWAKPMLRNAVLAYVPLAILGLIGWRLVANDEIRGAMMAQAQRVIDAVAEHPEFAIEAVEVTGGSEALRARLYDMLAPRAGRSSLRVDVDAIRSEVEALGAVDTARVLVDPTGILKVDVVERVPAALFRKSDGDLVVLDADGAEIVSTGRRASYPELPLLLGVGATGRVAEALGLLRGVPGLVPRLRAMVLVGERRWDLVLSDDLILMLPEDGPDKALGQIMALQYGEDLLDRDIAAIDMRLPGRPVVRMTPGAAEAFRLRQSVAGEAGEDT